MIDFNLDIGSTSKRMSGAEEGFDPESFVEEIVFSAVPDEILDKIDESDLPISGNFIETVTGKKFLNSQIFPRQVQIGSALFGDACPYCSNPKAVNNLYDQDLNWIYDNVMFMRYGKCPKCGRTRIDLLEDRKFMFPNSVYLCCGQRCVTGDTVVLDPVHGMRRIRRYRENSHSYGFNDCKGTVLDDAGPVAFTKLFIGKPETVYNLRGEYGSCLGGTCDHPVQVVSDDGIEFKKLKDVAEGSVAVVRYGQDCFAADYFRLDSVRKKIGPELFAVPGFVDEGFGEWLGLFAACGIVREGTGCVAFASGDSGAVDRFVELTNKLFGLDCEKDPECPAGVTLSSDSFVGFLKRLEAVSGSAAGRIPPCILENKRSVVVSFLSAFCEESVRLKKDCLKFYGTPEFLEDLRSVLMNLGVVSVLHGTVDGTGVRESSAGLWVESRTMFSRMLSLISFRSAKRKKEFNEFLVCRYYRKEPVEDSLRCISGLVKKFRAGFLKTAGKEFDRWLDGFDGDDGFKYRILFREQDIFECSVFGKETLRTMTECVRLFLEMKGTRKMRESLKDSFGFLEQFTDPFVCLERIVSVTRTYEETYDFYIPSTHRFVSNGFVSHNSGKSIFDALIAHHVNIRFNTLTDMKGKRVIPYKYFNNPPSPFYGTFTAITAGQVRKNLWEPFKGYLSSPWYRTYFEILDYYGKKFGIELYKSTETVLQFNHKKLGWTYESPDKKKLRGATRIFFSVDELSWHDLGTKEDSKKGSAREVVAAGRNSLVTVRNLAIEKTRSGNYNVPTGYEVYVSSPAEANDIMMRKVREAKRNPSMLGYRYATWEFNPHFRSEHDIDETDPVILRRDFGADPPLGDKAWFSDASTIMNMVGRNDGLFPCIVQDSRNKFGELSIYPVVGKPTRSNTYPKILTIDNGYKNNCFAAVINHLERKKVICDFAFAMKPSVDRTVNLSKCFNEFVVKLIGNRSLGIAMVAYDRWNSLESVDALKDSKCVAIQYSLKYADFSELKGQLMSEGYEFCRTRVDLNNLVNYSIDTDFLEMSEQDPYFALLYQMLTVRDLGKTLAKPNNGDDDIFRAWALGAFVIRLKEYSKLFSASSQKTRSSAAIGKLARLSGGFSPASGSPGVASSLGCIKTFNRKR